MKNNKYKNKYTDIGAVHGKQRTFGYPVDPKLLDPNNIQKGTLKDKYGFSSALYKSVLSISTDQKNPRSIMIEEEEIKIDEEVKILINDWLIQAMARLPKNQEVCIYLRFRFDNPEIKELRTTKAVGIIVGTSQQTAHRHIKIGIKNLKKDFDKNLKPIINRLKS